MKVASPYPSRFTPNAPKIIVIAVRRNIDRFPEDFMFPLTREEIMRISQIVISSVHPGVKTLKFSKNVMAFFGQEK